LSTRSDCQLPTPSSRKIIAALSGPLLPKGISKELTETLKSVYSLSFAGFFRCGEVTYNVFDPAFNFKCRDVIIHSPDYLTVNLPGSKTDPFRKGVHIIITCTNNSTCAYNYMIMHLAYPGLPNDPLFFGRHKRSGAGRSTVMRNIFNDCLKPCLTSLRIASAGYSGHSFYHGAATWACMVGLSALDIQRLGHWTLDCFKLYVDIQPNVVVALNRWLHTDLPQVTATAMLVPPSKVWRGDNAL
jgi:hypothetical protein